MRALQPIFWVCIIIIFVSCPVGADVLVIANSSVEQQTLSTQDLEMIFLGKMNKWDDGQRIRLAVLRRGDTHEAFLSDYINKTPSKFSSFWKLVIVSGTGYPPKYFTNESDLIKYVSGKDGGIGYISKETPHEEVRVLSIKDRK